MTPKICQNPKCQREYHRSGRPEQRYCSTACHRAARYRLDDRPATRRCEICPTVFSIEGRRHRKRFCSMSCVATWREGMARLRRKSRPPEPPRERRKPGRLEWSIFGAQRGRGIAWKREGVPHAPTGWLKLLARSGYARTGSLSHLDRPPRSRRE